MERKSTAKSRLQWPTNLERKKCTVNSEFWTNVLRLECWILNGMPGQRQLYPNRPFLQSQFAPFCSPNSRKGKTFNANAKVWPKNSAQPEDPSFQAMAGRIQISIRSAALTHKSDAAPAPSISRKHIIISEEAKKNLTICIFGTK